MITTQAQRDALRAALAQSPNLRLDVTGLMVEDDFSLAEATAMAESLRLAPALLSDLEAAEARVKELEELLRRERDPSGAARAAGHEENCNRVRYPRGLLACSCNEIRAKRVAMASALSRGECPVCGSGLVPWAESDPIFYCKHCKHGLTEESFRVLGVTVPADLRIREFPKGGAT